MLVFLLLTPCCRPFLIRFGFPLRPLPLLSAAVPRPTPFRRLTTVVTMAAPKKVGDNRRTMRRQRGAQRGSSDGGADAAHGDAAATHAANRAKRRAVTRPDADVAIPSPTRRCGAGRFRMERGRVRAARTSHDRARPAAAAAVTATPRQRAAATRPLTNAAPRRCRAAADARSNSRTARITRIGASRCATVQHQRLVAHCDCCHRAALVSALRSVRSLLFPLPPSVFVRSSFTPPPTSPHAVSAALFRAV